MGQELWLLMAIMLLIGVRRGCHPTPLDLRVSSSVEKLVSMVSKTVSYSHILWVGFATTACYVFAIVFDGREEGRKEEWKGKRSKWMLSWGQGLALALASVSLEESLVSFYLQIFLSLTS